MAAKTKQGAEHESKPPVDFETKVSKYDRVSAILAAGVTLSGFFALLLFIFWLSHSVVFTPGVAEIHSLPTRESETPPKRPALEMVEPGDELPDVPRPQMLKALEAMTNAVSSTEGVHEPFLGYARRMGEGNGDPVGPIDPVPLPPVIPPWDRWEIRFTTSDASDYAKQLDFFRIELGAIHRTTTRITYGSRFSTASPRKRFGSRSEETRLYFVHGKVGALKSLSEQLLNQAGVQTEDKLLAQFYPNEIYSSLLQKERVHLDGRGVDDVRKTVFGVKKAGDGYEFTVEHQFFLNP